MINEISHNAKSLETFLLGLTRNAHNEYVEWQEEHELLSRGLVRELLRSFL